MRDIKQNTLIKFVLIALFFAITCELHAQVKISTTPSAANPDAMLEIESSNKGLLLPRLALVSLTSPAPLNNFVKGMIVYDTATVNDITPGMYYSDGIQWLKINAGVIGGGGMNVQKRVEIVATTGQTIFSTPMTITDPNKILLYRNGIIISFSVLSGNTIKAEIAAVQNDEIRIVQFF